MNKNNLKNEENINFPQSFDFTFSGVTITLLSDFLKSMPWHVKLPYYLLSRIVNLGINLKLTFPPTIKKKSFSHFENLQIFTFLYGLFFLSDYLSGFDMLKPLITGGIKDSQFLKIPAAIFSDWLCLTGINFINSKLTDFSYNTFLNRRNDIKNAINKELVVTWQEKKSDNLILKFSLNEEKDLKNSMRFFLNKHFKNFFPVYDIQFDNDQIEVKIQGTLLYSLDTDYQKTINEFSSSLAIDIIKAKNFYNIFKNRLQMLNESIPANWQYHFSLECDGAAPRACIYTKKLPHPINSDNFPFSWLQTQDLNYTTFYPKIILSDPPLNFSPLYVHKHRYRPIIVAVIGKLAIFVATLLLFKFPNDYKIIGQISSMLIPILCNAIFREMDRISQFFDNKCNTAREFHHFLYSELLGEIFFIISLIISGQFTTREIFSGSLFAGLNGLNENIYIPYKDMFDPIRKNQELTVEKIQDVIKFFFPEESNDMVTVKNGFSIELKFTPDPKIYKVLEKKILLKIIAKMIPNFVSLVKYKVENNTLIILFSRVMSMIAKDINFSIMAIKKIQEAIPLVLKFRKIQLGIPNSLWKLNFTKTDNTDEIYQLSIIFPGKLINKRQLNILEKNFCVTCLNDEVSLTALPTVSKKNISLSDSDKSESDSTDSDESSENDEKKNSDPVENTSSTNLESSDSRYLEPKLDESFTEYKMKKLGNLLSINNDDSMFFDEHHSTNCTMNKKISKITAFIENKRYEDKQPARMLCTQQQGSNRLVIYESIEKIYQYLLPLTTQTSINYSGNRNLRVIKISKSNSDKTIIVTFHDQNTLYIRCLPVSQDPRLKVKPPSIMSITPEVEEKTLPYSSICPPIHKIRKSDTLTREFSLMIPEVIKSLENNLERRVKQKYNTADSPVFLMLLTTFAKISYAIAKIDNTLIIEAFGGLMRSLLMRETPHDLDMRIWLKDKKNSPVNFLEKLKENKIIDNYKLLPIPHLVIFSLSVNHILASLRFLNSQRNDRLNLDFTFNALSLKIKWLDCGNLKVETVIPQCSQGFLTAIQNNQKPVIELIQNITYSELLLLPEVTEIIEKILLATTASPLEKIKTLLGNLRELPKNLHAITDVNEHKIIEIILSILSLSKDPKKLFRLLYFRDTGLFTVPEWLTNLVDRFIPEILVIASIYSSSINETLKSEKTSPFKSLLFSSFQNYLYKSLESKHSQSTESFWRLAQSILAVNAEIKKLPTESVEKYFSSALLNINTKTNFSKYYRDLIKKIPNIYKSTVAIDIFLVILTLSHADEYFPRHYIPPRVDKETKDFVLKQNLLIYFKERLTLNAAFYGYNIEMESIFHNTGHFDFQPEDISNILMEEWYSFNKRVPKNPSSNLLRFISTLGLKYEKNQNSMNNCSIS